MSDGPLNNGASTAHDASEWSPSPSRALLLFAIGYNVMHHGGVFFGTASAGGQTRVADWFDFLTPIAVLAPLGWLLVQQRAARRWWLVFAVGAFLYVEGHGIHLSANSISNVIGPSNEAQDIVHLWDEVVGHYVWFAGLFLALVAVAGTLHGKRIELNRIVMMAASVGSGVTWATNGLEGGTAVFSMALAAASIGYGLEHRRGLAWPIVIAASVSVLILAGYGIWHAGFPQPSSL